MVTLFWYFLTCFYYFLLSSMKENLTYTIWRFYLEVPGPLLKKFVSLLKIKCGVALLGGGKLHLNKLTGIYSVKPFRQ